MKKKMSMLLALALSLSLLAGCGAKDETAAPEGSETAKPADTVYTINIAHTVAEETSLQAGALKFKEYCEANSDGRLKVNVYPNSQLGSDRDTCEGVQNGQVTMMLSSNAVHANFIADSIIFDMPFTYPNTEFARKVLNNPDFIEKITEVYAAEGFHYIGASDQGFRTLTCNKEVHSPADLNGITIRTMENKYHMAAWDNLGANPTPLAFNELYTALQQGTVDAQENPIELIYANKFYEQQDYVVNTNHIFQTIVWIMNEEFYQSLPDDLKQVVDGASSEGIAAACQYQDEHLEQFSQEIKNYGTQFVDLTDAQREEFVAATQAVRDMVKADCDAELYEIYMAAVEAAK